MAAGARLLARNLCLPFLLLTPIDSGGYSALIMNMTLPIVAVLVAVVVLVRTRSVLALAKTVRVTVGSRL